MNLNYSIIKHTLSDYTFHYDFLIKKNDILQCWQFSSIANIEIGELIFCKKIFDHRLKYLNYQGPISNNRGKVQIIQNGFLEIIIQEDNLVRFRIDSELLNGNFEIRKIQSEAWEFKKLSD